MKKSPMSPKVAKRAKKIDIENKGDKESNQITITIRDAVIDDKVDAVIWGMVIKEKIEEIDNYIHDKV